MCMCLPFPTHSSRDDHTDVAVARQYQRLRWLAAAAAAAALVFNLDNHSDPQHSKHQHQRLYGAR